MTVSAETKKQLKAVGVCIGIMAVYYLLMKISGWIVSLAALPSQLITMALCEFFYALSALGLMKLLGIELNSILFRPLNRYGTKILVMFLIVITVKSALTFSGNPKRSVGEIILFTLTMLMVGIAEEGVFRGIIAESMLRTFGQDKKGRIIAALVSGTMFGAMHIINAASADLSGVLVQCAGAFAVGVFFAGLYYCTGCLALNIFIHAAIDWSCLIRYGFYGEGSTKEIISGYSPIMLIPMGILLVLFLCASRIWTITPTKKLHNSLTL